MPIFPGNVVADDDAGQLPDRLEIPLPVASEERVRIADGARCASPPAGTYRLRLLNVPLMIARSRVRLIFSISRIFGKDRRIGRQMCRDGSSESKIIACSRSGPARTGFAVSDAQRVLVSGTSSVGCRAGPVARFVAGLCRKEPELLPVRTLMQRPAPSFFGPGLSKFNSYSYLCKVIGSAWF